MQGGSDKGRQRRGWGGREKRGEGQKADKIVDSVEDGPIAVLLDTSVKGVGGGAGVTFDWEVAKRVQTYGLPVIVAGGLEPEKVRALHKIKIEGHWGKKIHRLLMGVFSALATECE